MDKITRSLIVIFLIFLGTQSGFTQSNKNTLLQWPVKSDKLTLSKTSKETFVKPLDTLTLTSKKAGEIKVIDGKGNEYLLQSIDKKLQFKAGGAIGMQLILLFDKNNCLIDRLSFQVDCETQLHESSGYYEKLLDVLYFTMINEYRREASIYRYKGKDYHIFVSWLRDHVHTLKGMKYFYPELKSGIDLYADSQREDGMLWDNYSHRYSEEDGSYWVQRFRYGDFVRTAPEDGMLFTRIPVENDVEYLFIEGIYYTWKSTGDDAWMASLLDQAIKALGYTLNSPLRWSEKFQLLKRGYTIDTWDFQNDEDAKISAGEGNAPDPMIIKENTTRFGVMFGDNTGMAAACHYLAEMLEYADRDKEANEIRKIGDNIQNRIDKLAWNGQFYQHHIPEDPEIKRDLGVDESKQVSLSNAYSLNRNISHDKAVQIIQTYQRLRDEMPETSPGEFYTIYPPFEKGYGGHNSKWNYMNSGVTSIVAGELAHGAFEHGYEDYGVDILNRVLKLAQKTDNFLHCTYRGKMPTEPERSFVPIKLTDIANTDFYGNTVEGVNGWTGEGENDLHEFPTGKQVFQKIPFQIIVPEENGRKACLGLSSQKGYTSRSQLSVGQKAKSVYLLHTVNDNYYAGRATLIYEDGSRFSDEIGPGKISNWWYPSASQNRKEMPKMKVAWRGKNKFSDKVGVCVYGLNNPHPNKKIESIEFTAAENGTKWMVLGVTLSDYPVHFVPGIVSAGIPDNWGAAAVVYALVEGLIGVKDLSQTYDQTLIAPRWVAADVDEAATVIKYEASEGYAAYHYQMKDNELSIDFTGSGSTFDLKVLLPQDRRIRSIQLDDKSIDYSVEKVEGSVYLCLNSEGNGVKKLFVVFED